MLRMRGRIRRSVYSHDEGLQNESRSGPPGGASVIIFRYQTTRRNVYEWLHDQVSHSRPSSKLSELETSRNVAQHELFPISSDGSSACFVTTKRQ